MVNEYYKTTDLYLAALLYSRNCKLSDLERDPKNPKRVTFVFEDSDSLGGLVALFIEKRVAVDLIEFRSSLYMLKQMVEKDISLPGGHNA